MSPVRRFCPRKAGLIVVNDVTGEDQMAQCGRNPCGYCGPWKARQVAKALGKSRPVRAIIVTQAGSSGREVGARIHRAVSTIRGICHPFEYAFVVHRKAGVLHAHIAQHGGSFPDRLLSRAFRRQGTGLVLWEYVRSPDDFAAYLMRLPMSGLRLNVPDAAEVMREHLIDNGERMIHGSRGYWRDDEGRPLGGMRAALAHLQRERTPPGSRWRVVPLTASQPSLPDLSTYRVSLPVDG